MCCITSGSASSPPYSDALIRAIVESGRAVVPTAGRSGIYPVTVAFPERLEDPDIAAGFPPDMWAEVQDSFKNFYTLNYFQANMETVGPFPGGVAEAVDQFRSAARASAPIMACR